MLTTISFRPQFVFVHIFLAYKIGKMTALRNPTPSSSLALIRTKVASIEKSGVGSLSDEPCGVSGLQRLLARISQTLLASFPDKSQDTVSSEASTENNAVPSGTDTGLPEAWSKSTSTGLTNGKLSRKVSLSKVTVINLTTPSLVIDRPKSMFSQSNSIKLTDLSSRANTDFCDAASSAAS
ncbi:unnamed protein product [Protopolystoma xenopodis]|uniref:Uncharacterized protein n=1 Tax=Protopolystoma xenopodis TaxID=117903 RepID=A0A448XN32_9PLAT|nr:unnamed protein product [Protopolystoma xenopodis]